MTALSKLSLNTLIVALAFPVVASANQTPTQTPTIAAEQQPDAPAKPHQPRPNPDASGKYNIGDGVTPPILVHSEEPKISKEMQQRNISGTCLAALTVDTKGNPTDVSVVRLAPETKSQNDNDAVVDLRNSCMQAVQLYRFKPAKYLGKSVSVDLKVEVTFQRSSPRF
jgi:hypothetical protein